MSLYIYKLDQYWWNYMGYFIMANKLKLRLTNPTPLAPQIGTPHSPTSMALNYINKGLFYSYKVGL